MHRFCKITFFREAAKMWLYDWFFVIVFAVVFLFDRFHKGFNENTKAYKFVVIVLNLFLLYLSDWTDLYMGFHWVIILYTLLFRRKRGLVLHYHAMVFWWYFKMVYAKELWSWMFYFDCLTFLVDCITVVPLKHKVNYIVVVVVFWTGIRVVWFGIWCVTSGLLMSSYLNMFLLGSTWLTQIVLLSSLLKIR